MSVTRMEDGVLVTRSDADDAAIYGSPPTQQVVFAAAQTSKTAALTAFAIATITGGYTSNALGAAHVYPSSSTDQINMLGSVTDSLLPGLPSNWTTAFTCQDPSIAATDANQGWALRPHTAAQIQGAGADGKAAILAARVKLSQLKAAVMAAKSQADLDAINW